MFRKAKLNVISSANKNKKTGNKHLKTIILKPKMAVVVFDDIYKIVPESDIGRQIEVYKSLVTTAPLEIVMNADGEPGKLEKFNLVAEFSVKPASQI